MIITMEQLLGVFCDVDETHQYYDMITNALNEDRTKGQEDFNP